MAQPGKSTESPLGLGRTPGVRVLPGLLGRAAGDRHARDRQRPAFDFENPALSPAADRQAKGARASDRDRSRVRNDQRPARQTNRPSLCAEEYRVKRDGTGLTANSERLAELRKRSPICCGS